MCHYVLQEYFYLAKQSESEAAMPWHGATFIEVYVIRATFVSFMDVHGIAATKSVADNNNLFYTRSISFSHFASCIDAIASHSYDSQHDDKAYLKCLDSVRDKNVPKGNLFSFVADTHTHTHG